MARARFLGPESQSDDEARPAAGKTTPPEEGEGGRPLAREPLSLTLPPFPSPAPPEADRARTSSSPHPTQWAERGGRRLRTPAAVN